MALLLSGSVELTVFNWISGEESTRKTIAPGALFSNYDGTTQAVEACWILVWDRAEFAKLLRITTFRTNVLEAFREMQRKLCEERKKLTSDDETIPLFRESWRLRDASTSSSDKMVFGWLLVGTSALLIWEIVKLS